jgi:hypothetical protein
MDVVNIVLESYFLITHAIGNKSSPYIAALDCNDAFGSVSHQLLNINLKNLGVPISLIDLIMDHTREVR